MTRKRISFLFAFSLALGLASAAFGVVVPGGGKKKSDCYAGFEVEGEEGGASLVGTTQVQEKVAKGGTCNFDVKLCINEPVTGCNPANVTGFSANTGGLALPALGSTHTCGETKTFTIPLKGKQLNRPGKMKIRTVATSDGKPKTDPDTLLLKCVFGTPPPFCGAVTQPTSIPCTSVPVSSATCPPNPAGGPNEADVTVANSGTDLDNGWTGTSHNFPVVGGSMLKFCLVGCDDTTNPLCGLCGPTGTGSINTETFGPPLPLLAANVPVCVANRFIPGQLVTGSADLKTGDTNVVIDLLSDVFLTTAGEVCPRCRNGACTSGVNEGKACTVEGTVTVAQAAGDKVYGTSRDCPPGQGVQFAGTLKIHLPLTSGKATCTGPRPCTAQAGDPSVGIPVQDDQCRGGTCVIGSCSGLACQSRAPDGSCLDSKGGISQACCSTDPTTPCFPTGTGNGPTPKIERTGVANPVSPPWGDGVYPKTGNGTVVSTFCEPATTSNTINTTTGLPGPGALILPGTTIIEKK